MRIFIALVLVYLINVRTLHAKIRYNGGDEPEQVACFKVKRRFTGFSRYWIIFLSVEQKKKGLRNQELEEISRRKYIGHT